MEPIQKRRKKVTDQEEDCAVTASIEAIPNEVLVDILQMAAVDSVKNYQLGNLSVRAVCRKWKEVFESCRCFLHIAKLCQFYTQWPKVCSSYSSNLAFKIDLSWDCKLRSEM